MKRKTIVIAILIVVLITACRPEPKSQYTSYKDSFFDTFNTMVVVIGYAETEEEFSSYMEMIHSRFQTLHKLYDKYNDYPNINNIKTINDNAGVKAIKVEREIIDLIMFAKEWNKKTMGRTNIAFGPVLQIWHNYRSDGLYDPESAEIPPMEMLAKASKNADIDKVIVDIESSTVFLADSSMSLDVGAIAKGYATEIVAQEVYREGMTSGVISSGGNVRTIGKPLDGVRDLWGIGIQNPRNSIVAENNELETVFIEDCSVVSSGDYQRYYYVGEQLLHHLIDPVTLMPATHFRAVTVVTQDSGVADYLSTELFLLPYQESRKLAESFEGVDVIWVMADGSVEVTDGMKSIMKSYGASSQLKKK